MSAFEESLVAHHTKAIRVILSCRTLRHLDGAENFCANLLRMHGKRSVLEYAGRERIAYIKMLEESEKKMSLCLEERRKIIRKLRSR
jgi:hypothetical protein